MLGRALAYPAELQDRDVVSILMGAECPLAGRGDVVVEDERQTEPAFELTNEPVSLRQRVARGELIEEHE